MFSNFTEETCTGTGNTLALAGETSGSIPFSASFSDGDLVAYVLEDSGGTIKVAGVGTYVSATDDITRNDTWSWNGTVVDDNPSTNIALSGGTHTVRCDGTKYTTPQMAEVTLSALTVDHLALPDNWLQIDDSAGRSANPDNLICVPMYYATPWTCNTLTLVVNAADATEVVQAGIARCGLDGLPSTPIEVVTVDVTATGKVSTSLSQTYRNPAGRYYTLFAQSDGNATFWNVQSLTHSCRSGAYRYRNGTAGSAKSNGAVNGIITVPLVKPSTPNGAVDPLDSIMVLPEYI